MRTVEKSVDSQKNSVVLPENVVAIIPVLNEAGNIETVLEGLARRGIYKSIVALDPRNTDNTTDILSARGAPFLVAPQSGYDSAVNAAVQFIDSYFPESLHVLFSDAGGKYDYAIIDDFLCAIAAGADMALGRRINAAQHLHWHQRFGTQLVLFPVTIFFKAPLHDIGPIRMVRRSLLARLAPKPRSFRWPTETLIKALALGARVVEVPLTLTSRQGKSKVSGNFLRSVRAGADMLSALQFLFYKE